MKKLVLAVISALLVASLLVLGACAKAPSGVAGGIATPAIAPAPPTTTTAVDGTYKASEAITLPSTAEERMIVRSGDMSLVVVDIAGARDEIDGLALESGGYVVSSQIWGEEQDMRGYISIRVPDEKFDQPLEELRDLAVRVTSESTSSQDVTEEYVDLGSRLKNAEATESQYLAILEKATSVEDILKVYDSLSQVRSEIEQIKGRMQYLERTVSMSLISVNLQPETTTKPLVRAGWSALEVLKSALRGIIIFGQWLGTIALWLLILVPIWGTALGVFLWRRRRKKTRAKSAP